jgi:ketosteroid isomerase-like protein
MKPRSTLAALFGVLVLSSLALAQCAQRSSSAQGGTEQALMNIEHKWADAAKSNDTSTVNSILSDKWITTEADGTRRTKSEVMDRAKKEKINRSEVSDMQVHMIDDNTAVVTGTWTGSGTDADGKPFDTTERFTDTFVKEGGQWKAVASQATTAKK